MLRLKGVSKFYYNKGVVASGFTKIDLELNIGEFVAITGESGSGKTTLINVISGLDTYEEGEMYINGEETSYYTESDFEAYRKKYIGNIFQNFNLVNSYTVYQNVELVLLMNGFKSSDVKDKINDLLKEVDLYKYRNTKAAKLSGGQKQRVAIARALAKETPIIVADEPTGNLDSKSALDIIELLHKISKDKLVIIVTHNYDQVEKYATRKIKMHDGKILEDTKLKEIVKINEVVDKTYGNLTILNKFKLGIRNTFNVVPKFLLLLVVYLFLTLSVISVYSSTRKSNYDNSLLGSNQYFTNVSDKRIVIKKKDKSSFTSDDYLNIEKLNNIDYVIESDLFLDSNYTLTDDDYYLFGYVENIDKFTDSLDYGVMPKEENEIVIVGWKNDYYLSNYEELFKKEYIIQNDSSNNNLIDNKLKVVGIKYVSDSATDTKFYMNNNSIKSLMKTVNKRYSNIKTLINNKLFTAQPYSSQYNILPSENVEVGKMIVPEEISYYCKDYYCKNKSSLVTIENLYYTDELELTISNTYNKDNFERVTGYKKDNYDMYSAYFFMNKDDYYSLYDKENYQSSVFVSNVRDAYKTISELETMGYKTLYVKDTLVDYTESIMIFVNIIQLIGILIAVVALFFISYFIIKIILKSRNIYFSTIRMLGASKKDAGILLNIELNLVLNIAYIIVIAFVLLVINNIINVNFISNMIAYLKVKDYIILYIILFIISIFISNRFKKKLFKESAMKTYREEV